LNGYTPETPISLDPVNLGGKMISDKKYSGERPLSYCLAASLNPAAAQLMNAIGVAKTVEFAHQAGIRNEIPPYPSIALGSADLSLLEMVSTYSMFPAGGLHTDPIYLLRIEDRNGNVLESFHTTHKEVISETDAYIMTKMMQGVVDFGTGASMRNTYKITAEIAGKTGTTNNNADGWFMGFTPQILGGVWVGADDPILRIANNYVGQGAQMAMPIWAYFFQEVYKDKTLGIDVKQKFSVPTNIGSEMLQNWNEPPTDTPLLEGEENTGKSESNQYIDVPVSDGRERVSTESKLTLEEERIKAEAQNGTKEEKKTNNTSTDEKKKGFFKRLFGKKDKN
jgi:penicillin-binding protein 1A